MEKLSTESMTVERKGIFDKNHKKRFELTFTCKDRKPEKGILIIMIFLLSATPFLETAPRRSSRCSTLEKPSAYPVKGAG